MDSMLNHYTAARKVRNDDAYSPGGQTGRRPDRATLAYCQRAREAYRGVPIVAGGVEASLRRLAHYDYWSDKVRRSILLDAKADCVVFGMGERPLVEIVKRLAAGESVRQLRDVRGVAYRLGASEAGERGEGREESECETASSSQSLSPLPSPLSPLRPSQLRSRLDRQGGLRRHDADHSRGDEPRERPAAGAVSRPGGGGREPAGLAA